MNENITSNTILYLLLIAFVFLIIGSWIYRKKKAVLTSPTPVLDHYSKDLTKLAFAKKLDPVIGRKEEIQRVMQILSRRTKNNVVLIGDPGVGKTAIVEGLAQKIASGDIPDVLKRKRILALDLSSLIAGTKYRGEFEKKLQMVMFEIERAKRTIILFIDELHILTEASGVEGGIAASDILKPALARGDLQAIGATTQEEYERYVKKDITLERRFQPEVVKEPSKEDTLKILKGIKSKYESHHQVEILDEALDTAIKLSVKYLKDRFLPDKAIDLIDEAGAKVRLATISRLKKVPVVSSKTIKEIISEWTDIPLEQIK